MNSSNFGGFGNFGGGGGGGDRGRDDSQEEKEEGDSIEKILSGLSDLQFRQNRRRNRGRRSLQLWGEMSESEKLKLMLSLQVEEQKKNNDAMYYSSETYKTELCSNFEKTGVCPYGSKCLYAHGENELRRRKFGKKYKTKMCKNFHRVPPIGHCPYGTRCRFIHEVDEERKYVEENVDANGGSDPDTINMGRLRLEQRIQREALENRGFNLDDPLPTMTSPFSSPTTPSRSPAATTGFAPLISPFGPSADTSTSSPSNNNDNGRSSLGLGSFRDNLSTKQDNPREFADLLAGMGPEQSERIIGMLDAEDQLAHKSEDQLSQGSKDGDDDDKAEDDFTLSLDLFSNLGFGSNQRKEDEVDEDDDSSKEEAEEAEEEEDERMLGFLMGTQPVTFKEEKKKEQPKPKPKPNVTTPPSFDRTIRQQPKKVEKAIPSFLNADIFKLIPDNIPPPSFSSSKTNEQRMKFPKLEMPSFMMKEPKKEPKMEPKVDAPPKEKNAAPVFPALPSPSQSSPSQPQSSQSSPPSRTSSAPRQHHPRGQYQQHGYGRDQYRRNRGRPSGYYGGRRPVHHSGRNRRPTYGYPHYPPPPPYNYYDHHYEPHYYPPPPPQYFLPSHTAPTFSRPAYTHQPRQQRSPQQSTRFSSPQQQPQKEESSSDPKPDETETPAQEKVTTSPTTPIPTFRYDPNEVEGLPRLSPLSEKKSDEK